MKNVSRKWMAVLLSIVLLFSVVLSACSSNEGSGNDTPAVNNDNGKDEKKSGNDNNPPAEKEREKLELNFFIDSSAETVLPKNGDFVYDLIEEKFNVDLNVNNMAMGDDYKNKLSLLIASGDAPDLFTLGGGDTIDLNKDGVMADLSNYQNSEKMPNLYNWAEQKNVDAYQLPNSHTRGYVPVKSFTEFAYFIRQDWLDNLGLKMPTNYEELTEVARAFSKDDPDGNGKNDTYALSMPGGGKTVYYAFPQFRKHGFYASVQVDPGTKDFEYQVLHPRTGGAIDDIRDWMDKGYIDPDHFLADKAAVRTKFAQNKLGMAWVLNLNTWVFDANQDSIYNQLKEQVPEANMVPFNPFPGKPMWSKDSPWKVWNVFSKTSEEKQERIVEILDWLYSEEGYLMTHYGIEGEHYTREGDTITRNWDAYDRDITENGNFLDVWDFLTPEDPGIFGLMINDPRFSERDDEIRHTVRNYPTIQGFGTTVTAPEDFDWGAFTGKRAQILVDYLFEPEKTPGWDALLQDLMRNYGGNDLFNAWTESMQDAGVEVNAWEDL